MTLKKYILVLAVVVNFLASSASPLHIPSGPIAPFYIPPVAEDDLLNNTYIVMLRDDVLPSVFTSHLQFVSDLSQENALWDREGTDSIIHIYDSIVAKGYAAMLSGGALEMIRRRPEVKYVEQNQIVRLDSVQMNPPWGLARLNHRDMLSVDDQHYVYDDYGGYGVVVYVLDTGINAEHDDFYGRAQWGTTYYPNEGLIDYEGHGTHVAGTIASNTFGVAKNAIIRAVKIFGHNAPGETSTVIKGIEWAVQDAIRIARENPDKFRSAVLNMSLGGGRSRAMDDTANNAVRAGAHVVVSAGNDNKDACDQSPAAAELVITVGATTLDDEKAEFSNWGRCVDVFAPGKDILSTWIGSNDATNSIDGTSMSSPHVAGLVAYFLSIYPHWTFNPPFTSEDLITHSSLPLVPKITGVTPEFLKGALIDLASSGKITGLPADTMNLLIYNNMTHRHSFNDNSYDIVDQWKVDA